MAARDRALESNGTCRRKAMRNRSSLASLAAALAIAAPLAAPARADVSASSDGYDVRGENDPARDVANVQFAVSHSPGGTVRLAGTFDFGTSTVFIANDVTIDGGGTAVIRGGGDEAQGWGEPNYCALYVGWSGEILDAPPAQGLYGALENTWPGFDSVKYFPAFPVKVTIRGIDFESPARAAIMIGCSRGATIEGNTIRGVRNANWQEWYAPPVPQTRALGIAVTGCGWPPYLGLANPSLADADSLAAGALSTSGPIRITDNVVVDTGANAVPPDVLIEPIGIVTLDTAADVLVAGNDVHGFPTGEGTGILIIANRGSTTIRGNDVAGAQSNGIYGWSFMFDCSYTVIGNRVRCPGGAGSIANGIGLEGDTVFADIALDRGRVVDSVVAENHVTMDGSGLEAIGLYSDCDGTLVEHNVIDGFAATAIDFPSFFAVFPYAASDNLLLENDLSGFAADFAGIWLEAPASGTVVRGNAMGAGGAGGGIYVEGAGNRIAGNDWSAATGSPSVWLAPGSSGNVVRESDFPQGTVCDQVLDQGTGNMVAGKKDCR
jgi:hypothetical protein